MRSASPCPSPASPPALPTSPLSLASRSLGAAAILSFLITLSACSGPCMNEQASCEGQCVSTASDPAHCGGCGRACGDAEVCSLGRCSDRCADGLAMCGRQCVDVRADAANCGTCGKTCAAGATCQMGRCTGEMPACQDRLEVQQAGTFDADLKVVTVSGRLTKNGAAVPDGEYRGYLIFIGKRAGSRSMPSFAGTGDATYRGEVFADTYDIFYQPSASCSSSGPLPCQRALLRSGVEVRESGSLDLDAKVITVSGRLTKNGAAVPDGEYRGYLVFALDMDKGGSRSMSSFASTGDATYRGEVFAGSYDVRYQPSASCRSAGPLPCQSTTLRSKVSLTASGALDLDAKVITVSGRLTRNGAAVPDGEYRGYLVFALDNGGSRSMPSFQDTGAASYQGEIFAGSYDVRYQPSASCRSAGPLPCQSVTLRSKVSLTASGALDLDAKVVTVSGRLTRNGAAVPDGEYRGYLVFALDNGGSRSMSSFQDTGDATYRGEVFAGSYDVRYQPSASCRSSGPLPCQSVTLRSKVSLVASGALDLDAKVVTVSGRLTRNGAAVPDGEYRGYVVFALTDGGSRSMPSFQDTGDATYRGEVFAGSYDVRYQPSASCRSAGPLPCQSTTLRQQVMLSASGALDLDAKVARVQGQLTRNGAAVPDGEYRGYVLFALYNGGSRSMPSFQDTGAASYQGEVFAGSYDVRYQPSASCRSAGPLPCQSLLIKGCPMIEEN